jgi:hypothetical protein
MSETVKPYDSINDTATTTEEEFVIDCKFVNYITNHDTTNDLYVSFTNSIDADTNYIVVKPETSLLNFKVSSKNVFFKSSAGDVDFSFLCVPTLP